MLPGRRRRAASPPLKVHSAEEDIVPVADFYYHRNG